MSIPAVEKRYKQQALLLSLDAGSAANTEYGGPFKANSLSTTLTVPPGTRGEGVYLPFPEFEVVLPDRSGGFEERSLTVEIAVQESAFLERLVSGYPFAPVTVDVYEYLFDDVNGGSAQLRHLYNGRLDTAANNVDDIHDVIRLTCSNDKERLNFSLGISANVQCSWVLGDTNCQAFVDQLARTVLSASGTVMTVTSAPDPGTYKSRLFNKGFVERAGVRILIKEWISGEIFFLAKPVPPEWVGEEVILNSGCDRARGTCIGIYDNLPRFGGLGFLMSAHNPIYEEE